MRPRMLAFPFFCRKYAKKEAPPRSGHNFRGSTPFWLKMHQSIELVILIDPAPRRPPTKRSAEVHLWIARRRRKFFFGHIFRILWWQSSKKCTTQHNAGGLILDDTSPGAGPPGHVEARRASRFFFRGPKGLKTLWGPKGPPKSSGPEGPPIARSRDRLSEQRKTQTTPQEIQHLLRS